MRYRSNNILALIPNGEDGIQLLKQAAFFQQTLGMKVFLYRIIETPSLFSRIFHAKKEKKERKQALKELREFASASIPENIIRHFTYRIKGGRKLPVLLRQSKRGGYEFIITCKDGMENCLETTDLDKLISRSAIPVMTVSKKHHISSINHILIPVNVLQTTRKKLLWATYFAKKYNAKITIVSVLSLNIELKHSLAWRNAEKLKHMLTQRGISSEVVIIKESEKDKHDVIIDYIEKEKPDMVIIRTHQESSQKDMQIGKFVSHVVHGSKVPVFTVNRFLQPMPIDFEI